MGGKRIHMLADPIDNQDCVNKHYLMDVKKATDVKINYVQSIILEQVELLYADNFTNLKQHIDKELDEKKRMKILWKNCLKKIGVTSWMKRWMKLIMKFELDEEMDETNYEITKNCMEKKKKKKNQKKKNGMRSWKKSLNKLRVYRGENAVDTFIRELESDIKFLYENYLSKEVGMQPLTDEERISYEQATVCHICEKAIQAHEEKVRDHDHMTGFYRGAAHMVCNLNYKPPRYIPIILHNLSNYDTHLFVKSLALEKEEIDVIECAHSFRFMSSSLDKLSSYLEDSQCKEVARYFNDEKFELLHRKGVFPYKYVTPMQKLTTPTLPSKHDFYDVISDSAISDEDYCRAGRAWNFYDVISDSAISDEDYCRAGRAWNIFGYATNLYGYAMTFNLPTSEFQWLSNEELEKIDK
ncbi:Recombination endonuclease VII [Popillia japonica]|uniref:Recombination endonuclease VII n=1 Tax=Popillia japonica TaxID=7064 RepID=A0AAW1LYN1_POPJA